MCLFFERVGTNIVPDLSKTVSRFPLSLAIGGCSANDLEPRGVAKCLVLVI